MSIKIENYYNEVAPKTNSYICADGWGNRHAYGKNLQESDWDGCQFRIPMASGLYRQAINIRITGRKVRFDSYCEGWVRIEIEFVGDDGPSTFARGWMKV